MSLNAGLLNMCDDWQLEQRFNNSFLIMSRLLYIINLRKSVGEMTMAVQTHMLYICIAENLKLKQQKSWYSSGCAFRMQ